MSTVFLSLIVLVFSHLIGAGVGHGAGLLFPGVTTGAEYVRRVVRGLVFGSATITIFVYLMRWFEKPINPVFLAVSVSTFLVFTLSNHVKVKSVMRTQRSNAAVYMKLSELSRTRLVQDLTATISALISSLIAYSRAI
jgi:ABC-type nitrate/sulfonate/bicarbonate transport system permease component